MDYEQASPPRELTVRLAVVGVWILGRYNTICVESEISATFGKRPLYSVSKKKSFDYSRTSIIR